MGTVVVERIGRAPARSVRLRKSAVEKYNRYSGPRLTLTEMRIHRLLSSYALAKRAGLTTTTVTSIEKGTEPRLDTIGKLCEVLQCRPEDIDWPGNPLGLKDT